MPPPWIPARAPRAAWTHGLRLYLAALVLLVLVPTLGVGTMSAWHAVRSYQTAFEDGLLHTARALALAVDREVERHISTLAALAASPLLDAAPGGDLAPIYLHARRAAAAVGAPVGLIDRDHRILFDTDHPFGAPLPRTAATEITDVAFRDGQPAVSNLLVGSIAGRHIIVVNVPVVRDGQVVALLGTRIEPEHFARLLSAQRLSGGGFASLADGADTLIARSVETVRFSGVRVPDWYAAAVSRAPSGLAAGLTRAGQEAVLAFQHLVSVPGWTVMVAEPLAAHRMSGMRPLFGLAAGGAAVIGLALVGAVWMGGRVLRPIDALTRHAERIAADEGAAPLAPEMPSRVAEFEALRLAIVRADAALRRRAAAEQASTAALRGSEARLRDLLTTIDLASIMVRDLDGTIRFWSAGCERVYGWTAAEAVGRTTHDLLHTVYPVPLPEIEAALERENEWVGELRHRTRSGEEIIVAARKVLRRDEDGRPAQVMESIADVTALRRAEEALRASEARFARAVEAARVGAWEWDPVADVLTGSAGREERLTGRPNGTLRNLSTAVEAVHPEDRRIVHEAVRRVLAGETDRYEAEFRTLWPDGTVRWLRSVGRAVSGPDGTVRHLSGVSMDVTEQVEARRRRDLLAREVDHRAKNALAVVQSVLRLTPADDPKSFASAVEARVAALARVHSLLAEEGWSGADLHMVAERELAPHAGRLGRGAAVTIDGPQIALGPAAVQPFAMVLHELATNAAKYGALSNADGRVEVTWRAGRRSGEDGMLRLRWAEHGGPALTGAPARRSFGSRVIEAIVRGQLGGSIERQWEVTGLVCEIAVPLSRVIADEDGSRCAVA